VTDKSAGSTDRLFRRFWWGGVFLVFFVAKKKTNRAGGTQKDSTMVATELIIMYE